MKGKIYKLRLRAKQILFAVALTAFSVTGYAQITYTFQYTGSAQSVAVLPGSYEIECWGADGGWGGTTTALTGTGGIGGYSKGIYAVTSPTVLYVYVGGVGQTTNTSGASIISAAGGWNGGGGGRNGSSNSYYRGGGGGGTDVRTTQNNIYADRIIVAGGGGGAGGSSGTPLTWVGSGGNGGDLLGQDGVLAGSQTAHNGKGGTQTAGGAGGVNGSNIGVAGSFGVGGDGGGTSNAFPAGGGGGGWYGGGGGATQGGGGAGGSGYIGGVTSGTTIMFGQTGFVFNPDTAGDGYVIIKELCSISLSVAGLNSSGSICAGNTLTLTTNAVSNHSWSTGSTIPFLVVSPTSNTVYGLTATSPSNCTSSAQVSITVNQLPVLNVNTDDPIVCLGKQAAIKVNGADNYLWSNSSTADSINVLPTQMTVYSVTGTNTLTGCSSTGSVAVDVFTPTLAIFGSSTICKGSTMPLTASADGALSYTWSTGLPIQSILVSPASHTIYVVSATIPTLNITCVAVNSIQVTVNPLPNIVIIPNRSGMCTDESVTFSAIGGTNYAWSWDSQSATTPSIELFPLVPNLLVVNLTGTGSNGCTNTASTTIMVNRCTGVKEAAPGDNVIQVYPNPSQGEINVAFNSPAELLLINETGQLVRNLQFNDDNGYKVNVSGLSNGIYFITGYNGTQRISKKVVISR